MPIVYNREEGGQLVRIAWIRWAEQQPNPKPSWLVPWEGLSEPDKEADRCIWDEITAPYRQAIKELADKKVELHNEVDRLQDRLTSFELGEVEQ